LCVSSQGADSQRITIAGYASEFVYSPNVQEFSRVEHVSVHQHHQIGAASDNLHGSATL